MRIWIEKYSMSKLSFLIFAFLFGCSGLSETSSVEELHNIDWSNAYGTYYDMGTVSYGEISSERFTSLGKTGVYVIRATPGQASLGNRQISAVVELWIVSCDDEKYSIKNSFLFGNEGNLVSTIEINGNEDILKEKNILIQNACLGLDGDGRKFIGVDGFLSNKYR